MRIDMNPAEQEMTDALNAALLLLRGAFDSHSINLREQDRVSVFRIMRLIDAAIFSITGG
jgi:hypothetical protein